MGLKYIDNGIAANRLMRKLINLPSQMRDRTTEVLEEYAKKLAELAKSYAPIKTGALEASFDWRYTYVSDKSTQVEIFFSIRNPITGFEYGTYLHETPMVLNRRDRSGWHPGSRTKAKMASNNKVGDHFLTRAVEDIREEYNAKIRKTYFEVLRQK